MQEANAYDDLVRPALMNLTSFRALASTHSISETSAARIHAALVDIIDSMFQQGTRSTFPIADLEDIRYAIVALADEIASSSEGAVRHYWSGQPLQLRYYRETTAGEGFFKRLDCLVRAPRRIAVLKVYASCLAFGFRGRFAGKGMQDEYQRLEAKVLAKVPTQPFAAPRRFRNQEVRHSDPGQFFTRPGLITIASVAALLALGIFIGNITILKVRANGLSNELGRLAKG